VGSACWFADARPDPVERVCSVLMGYRGFPIKFVSVVYIAGDRAACTSVVDKGMATRWLCFRIGDPRAAPCLARGLRAMDLEVLDWDRACSGHRLGSAVLETLLLAQALSSL